MEYYPHYLTDLSRRLRRQQTRAEQLIWERLRNRRFKGLRFRRQHRIGRYIADFYCVELRLVIEIEGGIHRHEDQVKYDQLRFEEFQHRRLHYLRISNEEVYNDVQGVLDKILEFRFNSPLSRPGRGGGGEGKI